MFPIRRKLRTFRAIYSGCRDWPAVAAARLGFGNGGGLLRLRSGLELEVNDSLLADWGQFFESAIADVYRVSSATADVIVDVGANLGAFSCLAAWIHPEARVYAFEPQDDQLRALRRNLKRNRLHNVVVSGNPVTGDGREVILYCHKNPGTSNIFRGGDGKPVPHASVTLAAVPVENARSIFLKLDCEGSEGELIEWVASSGARLPRNMTIACEYHPWCPVPIEQSAGWLSSAHFKVSVESHFGESYLFAKRG